MKKALRSPVAYVGLAAVVVLLLFSVLRSGPSQKTIGFGDFEKDLSTPGFVLNATIHDSTDTVTGKLKDGTAFVVQYPDRLTEPLATKIQASGATLKVSHSKSNPWLSALFSYLPIVILFGLFLYVLNSMQGGGSRVMQFGKAKAKTAGKDQPKVTFADVAGADEAVAELQEIKEFLESPGRFQALGAKIPKGVLLFGPPGTGKTLLARAVAGEAGVPFFSISGSDFVEMFVGGGRAGSVTCSSRPRPTPRPSCSWTRSTRSAVTAAPGSAVATTSGSRPSTSYWWRWTVSTCGAGSSSSPPPTARTSSIRPSSGPAVSTARSWSTAPT